jgi:hypothetical protein
MIDILRKSDTKEKRRTAMKIKQVKFPKELRDIKILFSANKILINSDYCFLSKRPEILAKSISFFNCSGDIVSMSDNTPT